MPRKVKTFEVCMQDLQNIIIKLEKGDLSLEESIKLYEQGVKLSSDCDNMLKKAKLKIEELSEEKEEKNELL